MLRYFFPVTPLPHTPLPPPLPPHPVHPSSPVTCTSVGNVTQTFEILETMRQIESKMDLILTKLNTLEVCEAKRREQSSLEGRKKFQPVSVTVETSTSRELCSSTPTKILSFGDLQFKEELVRRVEELRAIKHMGESHGFSPTDPPVSLT